MWSALRRSCGPERYGCEVRIYAKSRLALSWWFLLVGFEGSGCESADLWNGSLCAVVEFLVGLDGSGCENANLCNLRPLEVDWVRPQRRTSGSSLTFALFNF